MCWTVGVTWQNVGRNHEEKLHLKTSANLKDNSFQGHKKNIGS